MMVAQMPKFSQQSELMLKTIHPKLQILLREAIKITDFKVLEGHRGEEAQNKAFRDGKTKVRYPNSKHNKTPSLAVDIAPYPVDWNNRERFAFLAGIMIGLAHVKGLEIRWGGDWNKDGETTDNKFDDLPHFELMI